MLAKKSIAKMSVEELKTTFGVNAAQGNIAKSGNSYTVNVNGKKVTLDPSNVLISGNISAAIGSLANVILDNKGRIIVVSVQKPPRCYHIICYYPADIGKMKAVDQSVRAELVKGLINEKTIPASLGKELLKDINAGI
jgi:hypothetical protein